MLSDGEGVGSIPTMERERIFHQMNGMECSQSVGKEIVGCFTVWAVTVAGRRPCRHCAARGVENKLKQIGI